tara:strand:+ start:233 stop:682 length:450 start_codon:yes stop_codon:yes gene_type:complete
MKVILIQDVENLGKTGDSVNVKNGYARNFLIPNKLALFASDNNMQAINTMLKQQELKNAKERTNLESLASILNKLTLKFELEAGDEGKLFGSVTSQMISDELDNQGLSVNKKEIILDEPIKETGSHKVKINLGEDLEAAIKIKINEASE